MQKQTLSRKILGMELAHPVFGNAAGTSAPVKTVDGVRALSRSAIQVITVGSATVASRAGNGKDGAVVKYLDPKTGSSRNTIGLENGGYAYWEEALPEMVMFAHGAGKYIGFSIAGFNTMETLKLARLAIRCGVDFIEINMGCPNIKGEEGVPDRILCFDHEGVEDVLQTLTNEFGEKINVSIKISPDSDRVRLKELCEILGRFEIVKAVMAVNTIPDTLSFDDDGNPHITFKDGLAGGAGTQLHGWALGQVRLCRTFLPLRVKIVGVGGVGNGRTARDFLLAGADAVEIGTAFYFSEDASVFGNVAAELIEEGLRIGLFDQKDVEVLAASGTA